MTPKRIIFLASGILAAIGILVSVVIIAIGGGFSGDGPSIFNPPTSSDLWTLGSNINDGMNLTYSLTSTGAKSSLKDSTVSMAFGELGDKWNVNFNIQNGSGAVNASANEFSANFSKKQLLRTDPIAQENDVFVQPIERSIMIVRDLAKEPRYLVVGAVWDKIFTGSSTKDVKIEGTESVTTPAGSYDVYSLEYKVGNSITKIYLNKDLPFPVLAQAYDENDKVVYSYELQSISR